MPVSVVLLCTVGFQAHKTLSSHRWEIQVAVALVNHWALRKNEGITELTEV